MDYVDSFQLKRIFNYSLATNRDNYDAQLDCKHEHEWLKSDPEMVALW